MTVRESQYISIFVKQSDSVWQRTKRGFLKYKWTKLRTAHTLHTQYFLACDSRPSYRLKTESQTQCEANSVSLLKNYLTFSRIMSLSQSSLLDLIPSLIHNSLSLYFYHLAKTINHLIRGQQDSLVFWLCKSVVVKFSSTEITPIRRPSRRTSFCSGFNRGENVTSTIVSSEVDERQSLGMLTSSLYT